MSQPRQYPPHRDAGRSRPRPDRCALLGGAIFLALALAGCTGLGFRPSHGTGAADVSAGQGFGLEVSPYNSR